MALTKVTMLSILTFEIRGRWPDYEVWICKSHSYWQVTAVSQETCSPSCILIALSNYTNIFDVTPVEGIIYVKDEDALWKIRGHTVVLKIVGGRDNASFNEASRVVVTVTDSTLYKPLNHCGKCRNATNTLLLHCAFCFIIDHFHFHSHYWYCLTFSAGMCSAHSDGTSCEKICGQGALSGNCQWRTSETKSGLSQNYSTCSPSLATCPNGQCDELEMMHPMLCPQDCTSESKFPVNKHLHVWAEMSWQVTPLQLSDRRAPTWWTWWTMFQEASSLVVVLSSAAILMTATVSPSPAQMN